MLVAMEPAETHLRIRLNRPEKRNAMNQRARDDLRAALDRARDFPVGVITGAGDTFCAGIDLKEVQADGARGSEVALADWRALNAEIREHPAVFIAAVNGLALGGGVTLTGVCDLAIAAEQAQFGMPEVGFGMYPNPAGPAGQFSLPRKRAAWLVLTAERISATQAEAWGLINEVVAGADLDGRADALASAIGRFDPTTLTECKRALDRIPGANWRAAFEAGAAANHRIRARSEAPEQGLGRFRRGERNPGQG